MARSNKKTTSLSKILTWQDIMEVWKDTSHYTIKWQLIEPIQNILKNIVNPNNPYEYSCVNYYLRYYLNYRATTIHTLRLICDIQTDEDQAAFTYGALLQTVYKNPDIRTPIFHHVDIPEDLISKYRHYQWEYNMSQPFSDYALTDMPFHDICKTDAKLELRLWMEKINADMYVELTRLLKDLETNFNATDYDKYIKNRKETFDKVVEDTQ